ncbi:MAG: CpaF family protein [Actinomycetota bacterium]
MRPDLLGLISERTELAGLDAAERRLAMRKVLKGSLPEETVQGSVSLLSDWIDGFGPLTGLMGDPAVTDVLVNGTHEVWCERRGRLEPSDVSFTDAAELRDLIERLAGAAGIRVDASHPIGDGRLPDGSRLHVVLPPVSGSGPLMSIRRFPQRAFDLDTLVEMGLLDRSESALLDEAVVERRTIIVSGATGTGKTTLVNALLGRVPRTERVVVIEETPELRPSCAHSVSLLTRGPNVEGRGGVDQLALVRAALRMRPDRIVVGEVRGPEALPALQAMSTGHEGSLCTVHARSATEALERFVELARQFPLAPSEDTLRRQAEQAFDLVVHVGKDRAGARRVLQILERNRDD